VSRANKSEKSIESLVTSELSNYVSSANAINSSIQFSIQRLYSYISGSESAQLSLQELYSYISSSPSLQLSLSIERSSEISLISSIQTSMQDSIDSQLERLISVESLASTFYSSISELYSEFSILKSQLSTQI
jgi:hypothetical protein